VTDPLETRARRCLAIVRAHVRGTRRIDPRRCARIALAGMRAGRLVSSGAMAGALRAARAPIIPLHLP
jgi:hypothetical protein